MENKKNPVIISYQNIFIINYIQLRDHNYIMILCVGNFSKNMYHLRYTSIKMILIDNYLVWNYIEFLLEIFGSLN